MRGKERAAIRRLRAGIVPSWALERLSVAYEDVRKLVDKSLEGVLAGRRVGPLFVSGEWGVGKTHMLSFVQASARSLGVPSAMITLDATGFALNYPQRLYAMIAERLILEEHVGLRAIITHLVVDPESRVALQRFAYSSESGDLTYSLNTLCHCAMRGEEALVDEQYAWTVLLGLDLNWANYGYKRRAALTRLAALARMFEAVGVGGIVVLFDEAETIDQLWNIRSRLTAYATIGAMCQRASLWPVFGVTERFDRMVKSDTNRLSWINSSADANASWFLSHWDKGKLEIASPPIVERSMAASVARKVAQLYRDAYQVDVDESIVDRALEEWKKNPVRNPRRLIRSVVDGIDRGRTVQSQLPRAAKADLHTSVDSTLSSS